MLYSRDHMEEVFATGQYWYIDQDGNLVVETTTRQTHRPTEDDLATDHPLLPTALRMLVGLGESSWNSTAPAAQAYFTRFILHRPLVEVVDGTGSTWKFALASRFFQPADPLVIRLTGAAVDVVATKVGAEIMELVTAVHWLDLDIPKTLMDAQYPGWEERIVVAEQLGVASDDLLQYVLTKPAEPVSNIDLSAVSYS